MRDLLLDIDPALGRRAGLEQAIREAIRTGRLGPGATLPSTRALASDQGLSRSTVVAAYEQLAIEGYLLVRQGAATTVAELRPTESRREIGGKVAGRQAAEALVKSPHKAANGSAQSPRLAIDMRPGEPDGSLFPRAAWLRSLRRTITDGDDALFGYGNPLGHKTLRVALAEYLGRSRAVFATPGQVSIFGGATACIAFLGEVLQRGGIGAVAVENPGPFLIRQALELVGVEVIPIPMDADGLRVDLLAESNVRAVVVTPANQYPTGITMSPARRNDLLRWARERHAWIIEDDYDGEFRYDRQTIGSLQGMDPDRVLYIGTASKSLSPGLRMSWLITPDDLASEVALVKHFRGAPSTVNQVALGDFIIRGELDRHLRVVRKIYDRRHQRIREELQAVAPWLRLPSVDAGLHLAATFDGAGIGERELVDRAAAESIWLLGLGPHWMGPPEGDGIVFGFSRLAEHRFSEGIERLSSFLAEVVR